MKRLLVVASVISFSLPASMAAAAGSQASAPRPADLADEVAGTYAGDVISDARGSSQSGVTVTISRVGPNLVEVRADYARIPTVRIPLTRAMNAIVQARGDHVFVINRDVDPRRLDLTIDDASLSLQRQ